MCFRHCLNCSASKLSDLPALGTETSVHGKESIIQQTPASEPWLYKSFAWLKNKYSMCLSIQSSLTLHFMSFCCLSKGEAKPRQFVGWAPAQRFPGLNSSHTDPLNIPLKLFIHSNWERNVCQPGTPLLAQGLSSIPSWILKNDNCESQRKLKQEAEEAREGRTEQQERGKAQKEQPHQACSPFAVCQGQVKLENPQGGTEPGQGRTALKN